MGKRAKRGRPKIHKIKIDQRKDPKGYQKQYYRKRTAPLRLESYLAGAKAIQPPKRKNEWSF